MVKRLARVFSVVWRSGGMRGDGVVGYDVALDDISVRPLLTGNNPVTTNDNLNICTPTITGTIDVLANDTGGIGTLNPSTISIYSAPAFNLADVVVNANNTITFTAKPAFASGTTTFTYQVCNTSGCCSTASVTVSMGIVPNITTSSTNTNCTSPRVCIPVMRWRVVCALREVILIF